MSTAYIELLVGGCCGDDDIIIINEGVTGPTGIGVPPGGTIGQVLAKDSNADFDTIWITPSGGGGGGSYVHTQASANIAWVISHGLGFSPNVEVLDGGLDRIVGFQIAYDSLNQLTLTFSASVSGTAYLS